LVLLRLLRVAIFTPDYSYTISARFITNMNSEFIVYIYSLNA